MRLTFVLSVLFALTTVADAGAQGGNGSLRGTVKDEQGAAMPGVTITATSPALLVPSVAVSDEGAATGHQPATRRLHADCGTHRILNLPPRRHRAARRRELSGRRHDGARHPAGNDHRDR